MKKKTKKVNMKNVCWRIGRFGGGNLDILRKAKEN